MSLVIGQRTHMSRAGKNRLVVSCTATAMCMLLLASTTASAQSSTTATLRGSIQDTSGGVLPGATVTLTNVGTKTANAVTADDRGQYTFAAVFPGTYHLRDEQ